jgi:hypothetical protein
MVIDFSAHLTTLSGQPLRETPESERPITLGLVAAEALLALAPDEHGTLTPARSIQRYSVASRIYAASAPVSLTAEEVADIKRLVALRWAPLIAGQACLMLENGNV